MSTSFSGVGCAESAVMSLAKASERFLKKKGISSVGHVKLESACEIDTKCQKVLKSTYGHCVFQDITKLDIEKKEENLASYNATTDYEFPDLNQYVHGRFIHGVEMLSSHVLPCTDEHAKRSGAPKLDITGVPSTALAKMAGSLSLRSFDVEKDEHPVKWLVDKLAINLMPAIHTWLQSVAGGFQEPSTVAIPAYGNWALQVPLLGLWYRKPVDGFPPLQGWKNTALDLIRGGYESWREPMECKLKSGHTHGAPIDFGALQVVKGLGRLSVLYFAVLWTFFNKNDLTPEQLADFERRTSMRGGACHDVFPFNN
ncbi:unnamed protein product [Durusdinium trenchii]|uniref:Uncharacterized protein n=1 Tax=Durusdinium trenchii TaxID=1381693 RepID=A0ABP0IN48_9DINO